ncbi:ThuA domain-containing protein [Haloferula sp.]|uniref:ThuA domain-containing protein n=1 Tax=Haloferula sp. TaxID=2497595 RepID=UPI003C75B2A8
MKSFYLLLLLCSLKVTTAAPVLINDPALEDAFSVNVGALSEHENHRSGEYLAKAVNDCPTHCEAPPLVSAAPEDPADAVFLIGAVYKCDKCDKWHISGIATAWCLSADGLMVTNHHVLEKAKGTVMGVTDRRGKAWPITEVVAADPAQDIAIFRVDGEGFSPLPLGKPADVGTPVRVISHPARMFYTQTFGEVARYHVGAHKKKKIINMMITADYAKGSSGGPVLNPDNEVVGIVSSTKPIYYSTEKGKPTGPLQMVVKNCMPVSAIHKMFKKETAAKEEPAPVKALLVTGGCCHDYQFQAASLTSHAFADAKIDWTVVLEGGEKKDFQNPLYNDPDWAKPYDVVVHNACFANTTDADYIRKITAAHKGGTPAVVVHCAMHTYRGAKIDDWRELLGVTSRKHEHQSRYPVKTVKPEHPIMKGVPADWVTPMDELYIIEKTWPSATVLATSASEKTGKEFPVIWTNDFHGARVFGTTYGHTNEAFENKIFLDLLTRGILWSAGTLD